MDNTQYPKQSSCAASSTLILIVRLILSEPRFFLVPYFAFCIPFTGSCHTTMSDTYADWSENLLLLFDSRKTQKIHENREDRLRIPTMVQNKLTDRRQTQAVRSFKNMFATVFIIKSK